MKVLFPATHYYPVIGGIETWTREIAEGLSQKVEVFVVTGKVHPVKSSEAGAEQFNRVKIFRTSLFSLTNLSHSPIIYSLSVLPFIFFKSLSLIKKEKINIIHCQGFLSSFIGFLLSKLTGVPYIVTVQRIEQRGNLIKEMVYRQAYCCIGASRAIKGYFEAVGAKRIEVIPNGIDLTRFQGLDRQKARNNLGLGNEFTVMAIARLEKVKGLEYLIRAVKDFQLLIIGDGSERKNLENLVKTLKVGSQVKFLGPITNDKVPGYLAGADCFCLPSLREGFGIVILEAQAAGVPVIGTKVGGILDLVQDNKTGILVEPKNPEAIASAVIKISSNPEFANLLIQNAKNNLMKYDWHNISQQVFNVYQKCLN